MTLLKKYYYVIILVIIVIFNFIIYYPSINNEFTNLDDNLQVVNNQDITNLDFKNIKKIFTSQYVGMYQPLTTLSFATEYHFFKLNSKNYFLDNIILHLINIILVYLVALKLIKNKTTALITSGFFAFHPLFAEAICWISARSTLLFSLFYLLSMIFYIHFKEKHKTKFYIFSLGLFILSVLSKAMAVTLPVILILLDYFIEKHFKWKYLYNKIPFFIISLMFGIIAFLIRENVGDLNSSNYYFNFFERAIISVYQINWYVLMSLLPFDLSPYYPDPQSVNIWHYLSLITIPLYIYLIIKIKKHRNIILFALLFLLFSLGLILKIFVLFDQNVAGRYTYLAYFGVFITTAYFINKIKYKSVKYIISAIILLLFLVQAKAHINDYKNSFVLWNKVLKKYPRAYIAYINLADAYKQKSNYKKALEYVEKGLSIKETAKGLTLRGFLYSRNNKPVKAFSDYNKALQIDSLYLPAYINRGNLYLYFGDYEKAVDDFDKAIKLYPEKAEPYFNKGVALDFTGKTNEAIEYYNQAIELNPDFIPAIKNRSIDYIIIKNTEKALSDINHAININPHDGSLYMIRADIFISLKNFNSACNDLETAQKLGIPDASKMINHYCKK